MPIIYISESNMRKKIRNTIKWFEYYSTFKHIYDANKYVINIYSNFYSFSVIKCDGKVISWGNNKSGGIIPPNKVHQLHNITDIISTIYAFAALKSNGSVITWGENIFGGNSKIANYIKYDQKIIINFVSVEHELSSGVIKIFANLYSFAALKFDGSVITWGYSLAGGNSSIVYYYIGSCGKEIILQKKCVKKLLTSNIINIFNNKNAWAALKSNGSVITWGNCKYGGDSSSIKSNISSEIVYIASTGSAFAALKSNGSIVTWGSSSSGGDSTIVCSDLSAGVISIQSTMKAFAVLKSNGSVITWGSEFYGGNSILVNSDLSAGVVALFSNSYAFAALKSNGSVITWGNSEFGGDSSNISNLINSNVVTIFTAEKAFAALKQDNSIISWGDFWIGGNISIINKNITYAYGGVNFSFISTNQQIPLRPTFISKSIGSIHIGQYDLSRNISKYEYKLINWTNVWISLNISNSITIINMLGPNKSYYISLRAVNSTGYSDPNEFLVQSNSNGLITINIVFSNNSTRVGNRYLCKHKYCIF